MLVQAQAAPLLIHSLVLCLGVQQKMAQVLEPLHSQEDAPASWLQPDPASVIAAGTMAPQAFFLSLLSVTQSFE